MPDAVYAHHGRNERSPSGDPRRYHEIQRSAAQVRRLSFAPARLGRAPGKLPHPYIFTLISVILVSNVAIPVAGGWNHGQKYGQSN